MPKAEHQKRFRKHVSVAPRGRADPVTLSNAGPEPNSAPIAAGGPAKPEDIPSMAVKPDASASAMPKAAVSGSKKERRALRHEKWLAKMHGISDTRQQTEAMRRKVQRNGAAGNLTEISLALDEAAGHILDLSGSDTGADAAAREVSKKTKVKATGQRARRREGLAEMARLQTVLRHAQFQRDALGTVRQHVRNTQQQNTV